MHVWIRRTDALTEADLAAEIPLLSLEERERHARFRFARDRRDFAAAHALLRRSLSRYADLPPNEWVFQQEAGGKPSLGHGGVPPLSFNLSHTDGLVACAIATGLDVGIDVETVDRRVDVGVAERFFSAAENAGLRRSASAGIRASRFFELWTLKEAYVKALGQGLSHALDTIVFQVDGGTILFTPPPGIDAASWQFALFSPTDRHRLAVAARRGRQALSIELFASE